MNDETDFSAAVVPSPPNRSRGDVRLSASWWSRRTRFQLTPLMDLLLIIVFAQFLDVREVTVRETASLESQREKLTTQISRERSELAGIREALASQRTQLEQQRDQARAARDSAVEQTETQLAEMRLAMEMIGNWFELDENSGGRGESADRGEGLDSQTDPNSDRAEDPVGGAITRATELGKADPDAMIRFLIGHAELLKRAEIWTVNADANGNIRIEAGDNSETFRLESKTQTARTNEVADRLFAAYKQFPQPKGLVILLVSYEPQSVAGVYQPLVDALPAALERLRADTPETRFEYTVLGSAIRTRAAQETDAMQETDATKRE